MAFLPTYGRVCRAAALALTLACASIGFAGDNWVDCENGSDVTGAGTVAFPWQSIQFAVASSNPNDVVRVKAGVCDPTNQTFPINMMPTISVIGAGTDQTFVDNVGAGSAFTAFDFSGVASTFTPNVELSGLNIFSTANCVDLIIGSPTITNNVLTGGDIGVRVEGYYLGEETSPIIVDNLFEGLGYGVRIYSDIGPTNPIIKRNWFLGTDGLSDAGIGASKDFTETLSPVIENNVIANSRLGVLFFGGTPTLNNNTISLTDTAMAFYSIAYGVDVMALNNNLLAYNNYGVIEFDGDTLLLGRMDNNNFFANAFSDYEDWNLGPLSDPNILPEAALNVKLPPDFINPGAGDYHLMPLSPVRDIGTTVGTPIDDIDKESRSDGMPDIGADETMGVLGPSDPRVSGYAVLGDHCPGQSPPGGDTDIDSGETIDVSLQVTNFSPFSRATNAKVTFFADGIVVTPLMATVDVGSLEPLETITSAGTYTFRFVPVPLDCTSTNVRVFAEFTTDETGPLPRRPVEFLVGEANGCQVCGNPQKPNIVVQGSSVVDLCSNGAPPGGNGRIEPGEDGELSITVENLSASARGSAVTATITSPVGVTPSGGVLIIGNVGPSSSVASPITFDFQVDPGQVSCGDNLDFDIQLDWLERLPDPLPPLATETLSVPASCQNCNNVAPDLDIEVPLFVDHCFTGGGGDQNGQIDPGESLDLTLQITNKLPAAGGATGITGIFYSLDPLALPVSFPVSFPPVAPGATVSSLAPVPVLVDATVSPGTQLNFELELTTDQTGTLPRLQFSVLVASPAVVCSDISPLLNLAGPDVVDICRTGIPGGDGMINIGERIELTLNVVNNVISSSTAYGVTAEITTMVPYIAPTTEILDVADILPNDTGASVPFVFDVSASPILCGDAIDFMVTIRSATTPDFPPEPLQYIIQCPACAVPSPTLTLVGNALVDQCPFGDPPGNDGILDSGEIGEITLEINNTSTTSPATFVSATFSTSVPGISPSVGTIRGADIPPNSTGFLGPFRFQVDVGVPCATDIPFTVRLSTFETGVLAPEIITVSTGLNCQVCEPTFSAIFLYRSSVANVGPGWKGLVPLPLNSFSARDGGWPRSVTLPGSQTDVSNPPDPLVLYRVLTDLDDDLGNRLLLVKDQTNRTEILIAF